MCSNAMAVKDKQVWLGNVLGGMQEVDVLDYIAQLLPADRTSPFKAFFAAVAGFQHASIRDHPLQAPS